MADGNQVPVDARPPAANGADRRGPMRPDLLASPRVRLSGRLLARGFMAADGVFLIGSAGLFETGERWARPEILAGALLNWAILIGCGAYRLGRKEGRWRHLATLAATLSAGWAMTLGASALIHPAQAGMADAAGAAGVVAGMAGLHRIWLAIVARLRAQGKLTPNLVVVGATPSAERLIRWALASDGAIKVIGVFDDRRGRAGPDVAGVPILGGTADLIEHRILPYVDRIIITVPAAATARIAELTEFLSVAPNPVTLLLDRGDAETEQASIERIADFGLQQISGGRRSLAGRIAKRALDLGVGCLAAAALAPVFAFIALAVRLDSPGPALFRQKRHGYLNESFLVLKFRSMRVEAEDAQARRQVSAGDDRVTRVGRFLRRTSLDELPQLFNVIRGEMSLVGPRPHAIGMLVEGEQAMRMTRTYSHRHRIKPGLTGWAAVRGSRGPVNTPEAVRRRVELDLEYIERQSFWLDLRIMLLTLPCLLGDRSAVR